MAATFLLSTWSRFLMLTLSLESACSKKSNPLLHMSKCPDTPLFPNHHQFFHNNFRIGPRTDIHTDSPGSAEN